MGYRAYDKKPEYDKKQERVERNCLTCSKKFTAEHRKQFMCATCRSSTSGYAFL